MIKQLCVSKSPISKASWFQLFQTQRWEKAECCTWLLLCFFLAVLFPVIKGIKDIVPIFSMALVQLRALEDAQI